MSLAIIETGEVVEEMSRVEAERITARITDKLDAIADNLEQVLPLIGEALTRDAWKALGYASPTAYVSERFAGALTRLSPDVRRPVVAQLSAAGMSTRAIAPVVGVTQRQVSTDVRSDFSPTPAPPISDETSAPSAPSPASVPTKIIGMDGKEYSRPEPREPLTRKEPSSEATLVNDIRLYLSHIGTSKETARLPAEAKRHLIEALEQTINQLKGETS